MTNNCYAHTCFILACAFNCVCLSVFFVTASNDTASQKWGQEEAINLNTFALTSKISYHLFLTSHLCCWQPALERPILSTMREQEDVIRTKLILIAVNVFLTWAVCLRTSAWQIDRPECLWLSRTTGRRSSPPCWPAPAWGWGFRSGEVLSGRWAAPPDAHTWTHKREENRHVRVCDIIGLKQKKHMLELVETDPEGIWPHGTWLNWWLALTRLGHAYSSADPTGQSERDSRMRLANWR